MVEQRKSIKISKKLYDFLKKNAVWGQSLSDTIWRLIKENKEGKKRK